MRVRSWPHAASLAMQICPGHDLLYRQPRQGLYVPQAAFAGPQLRHAMQPRPLAPIEWPAADAHSMDTWRCRHCSHEAANAATSGHLKMPDVRITAFPCHWLTQKDTFATRKIITWSTGEGLRAGDIQVFAVSATLAGATELANDPRRDAVHSIWKALTSPCEEFGDTRWPIQAKFRLLVKLVHPVPKEDLVRAGILNSAWPERSRGKMISTCREIIKLAQVLAKRNPRQREEIFEALRV